MTGQSVHVESFRNPLEAVRGVLDGADEAILAVAFVQRRGVSLVERQLQTVGVGRLVATTVFGSTTSEGLEAVRTAGFGVRVLNPSGGTFHPKLYLARHGAQMAAAVGSANLTSGLVANVELVTVLRGDRESPAMRALVELSESWWSHREAIDWTPERVAAPHETLEAGLLAQIGLALAPDPEVLTLGDGKPNWVREITPEGLWVETRRSHAAGRPPQLVEAWMIQSVWDYVQAHGALTSRFLLGTGGLNVKRSSFVSALLARLLGVRGEQTRPNTLALRPEPRAGHPTLWSMWCSARRQSGSGSKVTDPSTGFEDAALVR